MQAVLLVIALSIDVFLACAACGMGKLRIKRAAAVTISGVCSMVLLAAVLAGNLLENIGTNYDMKWIGAAGFFCIGIWKLAEYFVKRYLKKKPFQSRRFKVTFSQLNFIIDIYQNPIMADLDHSATMSVGEAFWFALAMSLDGLLGGVSAGVMNSSIWIVIPCNFLIGLAAVLAGSALGVQVAEKRSWDLSWVGGVLFLILALGAVWQS